MLDAKIVSGMFTEPELLGKNRTPSQGISVDLESLMAELPETHPEPSAAQVEDEMRAGLLKRVFEGEVTPQQAEEEWKLKGFRPLRREPTDFTVDRDTATMWTPEMVAIWFATKGDNRSFHRHFHATSDNADWWRPNAIDDCGPAVSEEDRRRYSNGHRLSNCERTRLFFSFYEFDGSWQEFPPAEAWYPQLQKYLIAGEIIAVGYRLTDGEDIKETIPPLFWTHAKFENDEWATFLISSEAKYWRVVFPGDDVLSCQAQTVSSHPWKRDAELNKDESAIFDALRKTYPYAFPAFQNRKERDAMIMPLLEEKILARWPMSIKNTNQNEKAVFAFARAMDRLFDKIILDPSKLP